VEIAAPDLDGKRRRPGSHPKAAPEKVTASRATGLLNREMGKE
jgi:hypothetical protein